MSTVPAHAAVHAVGLAPDLKKRVEAMAEHVARNGVEFEQNMKQKNASNPQFAFMFGSEGGEYYTHLLQAYRGSAAAQMYGGGAGQTNSLADILQRWQQPQVSPLPPETEKAMRDVIASLELVASKDAIGRGRTWLEANAGIAHAIAGNLMQRIGHLLNFSHRLHVLFLLHEAFMQEASSKQDADRRLARAFKPFVAWLLRPAYQYANATMPGGEDCAKVLKLLQLWTDRGMFSHREAEDVKWIVTTRDLPNPCGSAGGALQGGPFGGKGGGAPAAHRHGYPGHGSQHGMGRPPPPPPGAYGGGMQHGTAVAPGLQRPGMTPAAILQSGLNPETVPVGVMASMLKQVSRRGKDLHIAFVPYRPLDPLQTPQVLPPTAPPTEQLMERLRRYYCL
eukprot:TRINITY_DN34443_c0_g1_i3.p1 TRINITY_DN34443_c0_g1~~TRINITY_DN34443_c0_g1_i3.p1  ORF type:complete len:393 (-),score=67.74 TRINITY_DN34443_c0_g1_i3:119-1297(-)